MAYTLPAEGAWSFGPPRDPPWREPARFPNGRSNAHHRRSVTRLTPRAERGDWTGFAPIGGEMMYDGAMAFSSTGRAAAEPRRDASSEGGDGWP